MLILCGSQRIHENFRQIVVFDDASLLSRFIGQARHQFGGQPGFLRLAARCFHNLDQRVPPEFKAHRIADFGTNRDLVCVHVISAVFGALISHIETRSLQAQDSIVQSQFLTRVNPIRRGVNLRCAFENLTAQLAIDDPRVIVVVIEDERRGADKKEKENRK